MTSPFHFDYISHTHRKTEKGFNFVALKQYQKINIIKNGICCWKLKHIYMVMDGKHAYVLDWSLNFAMKQVPSFVRHLSICSRKLVLGGVIYAYHYRHMRILCIDFFVIFTVNIIKICFSNSKISSFLLLLARKLCFRYNFGSCEPEDFGTWIIFMSNILVWNAATYPGTNQRTERSTINAARYHSHRHGASKDPISLHVNSVRTKDRNMMKQKKCGLW